MADEISVSEAAVLLEISGQTVRNYIRRGLLRARQPGARSFLIDRSSVEALLRDGMLPGRGRRRRAAAGPSLDGAEALTRERDDLRARVVELQEAVLRLRAAADLQRQADRARATQVNHLVDALRAAELADELRSGAAAELENALSAMAVPGHPGALDGT